MTGAAAIDGLRRLLKLPPAGSRDEDRMVGTLLVMTSVIVLVALLALAILLVAPAGVSSRTPPLVALIVVLGGVSLLLLRLGKTTAASSLTFGSMLGCTTAFLLTGEGIHDISILLLPVVLLFGGLFFPLARFAVLVLLSMLVLALVALAEIRGVIPAFTSPAETVVDLLMAVLILSVSAAGIALLSRSLLETLSLSAVREQELVAANGALAERERDRSALILELERRNEELERFTYTVSHDLKSPVVTIRGFLGYIRTDIRDGRIDRVDQDLERIADATTKMLDLLDDLLELSRVGRSTRPPEDVPLGEVVADALALVRGRLVDGNVTVSVAEDLPVVSGDRSRLVEVIQNLVDNAAKFMGSQPSPHVEISHRTGEGGETVVFVRDNGIGIEPLCQSRVFDLFGQLDSRADGTGIGLALVKRIVEVHGGRIWVESEGAGQGSAFAFSLPKAMPEL